MTHYVCRGECAGVSDAPGVCQAEDCARSKEALEACDCEDGSHGDAGSEAENKKEE